MLLGSELVEVAPRVGGLLAFLPVAGGVSVEKKTGRKRKRDAAHSFGGVAMVDLKAACGWPRLLATGAAQPQEDLVAAPIASCRFATQVASNLCHPASVTLNEGLPCCSQNWAQPDSRQRPLGIAVLEDKIVQQAVRTVLELIYEDDFLGD